MTQEDIYNFLKDNAGRKFTPKEISKLTGKSRNSVTKNLRVLRLHNEVKYKVRPERDDSFVYWV